VQTHHCAASGVGLQQLHKGPTNAAAGANDQCAEHLGERGEVQRVGVGQGWR